jgi:hypothetical protein
VLREVGHQEMLPFESGAMMNFFFSRQAGDSQATASADATHG